MTFERGGEDHSVNLSRIPDSKRAHFFLATLHPGLSIDAIDVSVPGQLNKQHAEVSGFAFFARARRTMTASQIVKLSPPTRLRRHFETIT
ncbi:hypothetical protein FYK55_17770 [Roseiconus nitratireducens]|uniref:Uncharacterized protein n=1 Tax=Roseiconus nitratireducens TaxID=2605748 RepID=A0A5M6D1Q3_9BACT|nr:hypothetical protein [Roseiconus nitratireducens]KAA5541414.1 hypothetical protein FYK55_17770 [Roseiconus nitratireducens]